MTEESRVPSFETEPAALETAPAPLDVRPPREVSLFWRTFFLLSLLLLGCIVAWLQTFRALEFEPGILTLDTILFVSILWMGLSASYENDADIFTKNVSKDTYTKHVSNFLGKFGDSSD